MRPSNSSPKKRRKKGSSKNGSGPCSLRCLLFLTEEILTTEAFACLAITMNGCAETPMSPAGWTAGCAATASDCGFVTSDGGEQLTTATATRNSPQTSGIATRHWIDVTNRCMTTPPRPSRITGYMVRRDPWSAGFLPRDLSDGSTPSPHGRVWPIRTLRLSDPVL